MTVAALLLAGGRGMRAGGDIPKQYQKIAGKPILRRAVEAFLASPSIGLVQVVIHQDDDALYRDAIEGLVLPDPVYGGAERHLSALRGQKPGNACAKDGPNSRCGAPICRPSPH